MNDRGEGDLQQMYAPLRAQGRRFSAAAVADLYRHRPPYSQQVFDVLDSLMGPGPRTALDAGAGPGKLARELVARGYTVDAVDPSAAMIRVGQGLPHGDNPALRWIESSIEEAPLQSAYGLIVAGASFHWFDADRVLPRFAEVLRPGAYLAIMDGDSASKPAWAAEEREILLHFVERMTGKRPIWQERGPEEARLLGHERFEYGGHIVTRPTPFRQSLDDYIACQHSRATFTPETMGPDLAQDFDVAMREMLAPHALGDCLDYQVRTRVEWGRPISAEPV